jgi:regulatory LuxR family protein
MAGRVYARPQRISPRVMRHSPMPSGSTIQTPMSVATVKAHVSRLLVKLGVDNRVQIALLVQDATR